MVPIPSAIPQSQQFRQINCAQNADQLQLGQHQPPQQRWINQPANISQTQVEAATEVAYSVMTNIESKWYLETPTLETNQYDVDKYPGLAEEIL